jgi:hypothetical protein
MKTEIRYPTRDLDLALRIFRSPEHRIILEPGFTYTTRGAWAFPAFGYVGPAAGVELIAEGCDIVLKDPVIDPQRPWLEFPWLGGRGATIRGGVWRVEQPDKKNPMALSGFHSVGHCVLDNVKQYGICGSKGTLFKEKEVFGFRQTDDGSEGLTHIVGCAFVSVENNGNDCYNSGIFPAMHAIVEKNEVRLSNGQFGLSCVKPANFTNNLIMAARGFYTDYEADCKASLSNNQFETTYAGISFASKVEDPSPRRRELVSINDTFDCGDGRFVEFFNGGGKQSGYVAAVNSAWNAKYRIATTDPNMELLLIQSPGNKSAVDHVVGGQPPKLYA